ncbi:hypothetical protein [Prevotella sp. E13-27]|uniref:hypothetical protein n=1 Tax=Prevotella sp. E13-27 TaxID=2938122 RepID=UPI00200B415E|nr:hypothetical protein [Prevotella sp. E13-27]MCK8621824.1 hypothetical protein [Prevotella sp. E13-27]
MKTIVKFAAAAALMLVSTSAMAQYTPEAGTITTEVQFNPFGNNYNQFRIDGLKVRYFFSEKSALRVNLGFSIGGDNNTVKETYNNKFDNDVTSYIINNKETETTRADASFKVAVGYEHHIVNNGRMNIYIGGELGYRGEFYSAEIEEKGNSDNYNLTTTGAFNTITETKSNYTQKTEWTDGDDTGNASNHSFFAQAFTGLDFYIYKGLYVGTELGIRFSATSYVNPTYKTTYNENQDNITRYTGTVPAGLTAVTVNTKTNWTETSEDGRRIGKMVVNNPTTTPVVTETDIKTMTITPTAGAIDNTRTTARLNVYIEPAIRLGWKF